MSRTMVEKVAAISPQLDKASDECMAVLGPVLAAMTELSAKCEEVGIAPEIVKSLFAARMIERHGDALGQFADGFLK